jgi:hypothetical protein
MNSRYSWKFINILFTTINNNQFPFKHQIQNTYLFSFFLEECN